MPSRKNLVRQAAAAPTISPAEAARRKKLGESIKGAKHAFVKGKSGNPNGRPKGVRAKLLDDATRIKLANEYGITPLEFCMSVIRDPKAKEYFKMEAVKVAMPYMHQKKPIQLEGGDPNRPVRFDMTAFKGLSKAEQVAMLDMLTKAGVFGSDVTPA